MRSPRRRGRTGDLRARLGEQHALLGLPTVLQVLLTVVYTCSCKTATTALGRSRSFHSTLSARSLFHPAVLVSRSVSECLAGARCGSHPARAPVLGRLPKAARAAGNRRAPGHCPPRAAAGTPRAETQELRNAGRDEFCSERLVSNERSHPALFSVGCKERGSGRMTLAPGRPLGPAGSPSPWCHAALAGDDAVPAGTLAARCISRGVDTPMQSRYFPRC